MTLAIEALNVEKRYGALHALAGVSLAVAEGEFFGLLGPNGAGKTTLISVIAGLTRASAGRALGLIAGIWADKFDQIAAFQNFVILPLTFLSGVFYSIRSLPAFWQAVTHLNPFFYMIDGFRFGFFGVSDNAPFASLAVVAVSFVLLTATCLLMLRSGYKLRQ